MQNYDSYHSIFFKWELFSTFFLKCLKRSILFQKTPFQKSQTTEYQYTNKNLRYLASEALRKSSVLVLKEGLFSEDFQMASK